MMLANESEKRTPRVAQTLELRDNIRLLTVGFRGLVEDAMRPEGMTVAQLRMLFAVQQDPEASSASIARQCQVTPQTLQAMLQRAVREKWLVRRPAPHNARILTSTLTAKGKARLLAAKEAVATFEAEVWRDASTAELRAMNGLLARALERLHQLEGAAAPLHAAQTKRKSGRGA